MEPLSDGNVEPLSEPSSEETSSRVIPFTWPALNELTTRGRKYLAAAIAVSYLLWTVALVMIIAWGRSHNTFGMPVPGVVTLLSLSFLAGWIGPSRAKHIFYRHTAAKLQIYIWRVWSILLLTIYIQYLQTGGYTPGPLQLDFVSIAFIELGIAAVTQWTFIMFLEDHFANITWPFMGLLPMSCGYFFSLFLEAPQDWHLPLIPAWLILIGMILLYTAITLLGIGRFFGQSRKNFGFMYWVFLLSLSLMVIYAVIATKTVEGTGGMLPATVGIPPEATPCPEETPPPVETPPPPAGLR